MERDAQSALRRLRQLIRTRPASIWVAKAHAEKGAAGRPRLTVPGPFAKQWLETRCAGELRTAFGGEVEVVAEGARPEASAPETRLLPQGPANELAAKMIRAFVDGALPASPLLVVHGPKGSGKTPLLEWASRLAKGQDFRLDVRRLLRGASRSLLPRKPILVADSVEALEGRPGAQRNFCSILDAVLDRGGRAVVALRGHPAKLDLHPALRARLLGGVVLPVDPPSPQEVRARLRAVAQERGRKLDAGAEERLARLPAEEALSGLDAHFEGREAPGPDLLERLKDYAAEAFRVERALLDQGNRRRSVVEARRFAIGVLCRRGVPAPEVAGRFGLRSVRAVREACAWLRSREDRDAAFGALVDEACRVVPAR